MTYTKVALNIIKTSYLQCQVPDNRGSIVVCAICVYKQLPMGGPVCSVTNFYVGTKMYVEVYDATMYTVQ